MRHAGPAGPSYSGTVLAGEELGEQTQAVSAHLAHGGADAGERDGRLRGQRRVVEQPLLLSHRAPYHPFPVRYPAPS
ncbi:hypothetical protein [Streptomyces niveus]|uniref:hypothetical protein n=1 Tax=Streptomyces niveus TaxID=193462 RepID=UPI0003C582BC|nr:hypothetical protein [Streptomyces niveus]EST30744.1 hypothetical protein M877_09150 [Streptomyces niveus NCIMB 11891]